MLPILVYFRQLFGLLWFAVIKQYKQNILEKIFGEKQYMSCLGSLVHSHWTTVPQRSCRTKNRWVFFLVLEHFSHPQRVIAKNPSTIKTHHNSRGVSSKYCKVAVSCNNGKLSSILLNPGSSLYSNPLKIHWLTRNLPESWPWQLVKLGIADQDSEVRQHLTFNVSLRQIFTWKKWLLLRSAN